MLYLLEMAATDSDVTGLLLLWRQGDQSALERLLPLVYRELHKLAKRYMRQQNPGHTLQTTAVIHEAYMKLAANNSPDWQNRSHFFAVAAKAMRHVLVDHARTRLSAKRGGEIQVLTLDEGIAVVPGRERELVALDDALTSLSQLQPRQGQVVELRYFGGLSVEETAQILDVSPETVARDWRFAKSFLLREICGGTGN